MRRAAAKLTCGLTSLLVLFGVVVLTAQPGNATEGSGESAATSPIWQTNATVWGLAYANGAVYAAGDFTSVRPPGNKAGTGEVARSYMAAFDASTGALLAFSHTFTGKTSTPLTGARVVASPDGKTVYVGGNFTQVDGQTRNHVAAFDTTTGALTSWAPNVDYKVIGLGVSPDGTTVYVGGGFSFVNGVAQSYVAAINAKTGATVASFAPKLDNSVDAIAVSPDNATVYIGGYFTSVNGDSTIYKAAAVSAATGATIPFPAAKQAIPVPSSSCVSDVKDIVTDSNTVYFANEGTGVGCFDGTWAANMSDGSLKWINRCEGATQAIQVIGSYLYKGSHAHDCYSQNTNGDPDNFPQLSGQPQHLLAERLDNGYLGPWYPTCDGGPNLGPRAMATDGAQLWVGGDFTAIDGQPQYGLARFATTPDYPTPKPQAPQVVSTSATSVAIYEQPPVDLDDPDLTVRLYRDGGSTPIATANVHSLFWRQPIVSFVDTGLATGSTHSYQVDAIPQFLDGAASPQSATTSVTVTAPDPNSYAGHVLANKPSFFWRLDESNNSLATDLSPNAFPGIYGPTETFGQAGAINDGDSSVSFNGTGTSYLVSSQKVPSPKAFSEEAWIKTTSTTGGKIIGFGNGQLTDSTAYDKHVYMTNAGKIIFGVWNNSATIITSSGSYNDGNWHHIVATQGPSGMALYIDGNKVGSNNVTTNQNITGYWRVGGDNLTNWPSQPSNKWFNGQIDDVAVYPAALTPTQIVDHYTISGRSFTPPPNQTSAYAQLIRGDSPTNYYRLDETGGVVANDLSGNGNDGTFASGITFSQTGALPSDPDTAALFNGTSNGRLNSNALAPAPTVYSEELWFKTALGYIKGGKLIGYGNAKTSASTSYDRQVYMTNAGKLIFGVYTGTTRTITSTGTYNDGKWHYVVATQGPSGMALYVDGALIGSNGVTGNQSYNGYLRVGGDSLANWPNAPQSNYFNGTIDEVATYAYALTPAQVSKHYQVGLS